jgi:hypothetical protein
VLGWQLEPRRSSVPLSSQSPPHPHPPSCGSAGALPPQHDAPTALAGASEQPHVGSLPVIQPVMIADAHPTPGSTLIAPAEQFSAQAPHSMQAPLSARTARLPSIAQTPCGHTSVQVRQPVHFSASKASVSVRVAEVSHVAPIRGPRDGPAHECDGHGCHLDRQSAPQLGSTRLAKCGSHR